MPPILMQLVLHRILELNPVDTMQKVFLLSELT